MLYFFPAFSAALVTFPALPSVLKAQNNRQHNSETTTKISRKHKSSEFDLLFDRLDDTNGNSLSHISHGESSKRRVLEKRTISQIGRNEKKCKEN